MRRPGLIAALSALLLLAAAGPAGAQSELFDDFREDGTIDPCDYSPGQLQQGLPPDIEQYAPGLADQLDTPCIQGGAASGQAAGGLASGEATDGSTDGSTDGGAADATGVEIAKPPAPDRASSAQLAELAAPTVTVEPAGSETPGWLAPLLALLLAGAAAWLLVARRRGPALDGRLRSLSASLSESGDRAADRLAGLRDRLRFWRR